MAENAKWYVAHTYSGYENTVKNAIEKSAENRGMTELIQEVRIPTETVEEKNKDGIVKTVERKIFPGYVLVKMVMTDETWHLVRNSRGCTGFVGSDGKPVPLTDSEVEALHVEHREITLPFAVGDTVEIMDGPFAGFQGIVDELDPDAETVRLIVSIFNRETPVDLDLVSVRAIEE